MRAAPRRPRGPRVLGLGGGSPLARSAWASSSPAALPPLPAQVPLPGAARAAHSGPWPRPVPVQLSPRRAALASFCSGLLPYPGRPSWLSSSCTRRRSAELLRPPNFLLSEGKAAPGSREEMPESGASRGGRPPPGLRLDRRRVARGTSGRAGDCTPEGYSQAPSWKAEQRRPGSWAVAASDPAVTGKLAEEGSQPHRSALPSPGPTPHPPPRPACGVAGPGGSGP